MNLSLCYQHHHLLHIDYELTHCSGIVKSGRCSAAVRLKGG
jgi:hypothetical protein